MRASKSTRGKQGLGTPPGSSRQASESLAPLTPRCGSVPRPCRPSNRGSLHLGFPVAILHMLLPSCKPHAPSRARSSKAPARCPTFSPHGCCFCFVLRRAAVTFCGPCHLWLRSPFADAHDAAVAACLADLLGAGPLPDHALRLAQLPFLPVLHRQLPRFAADVGARLGAGEPVGPVRRCLTTALPAVLEAADSEVAPVRAWKLWFLLPGCCCTGSLEQGNCSNEIGASDLLHSTRAGGNAATPSNSNGCRPSRQPFPRQQPSPLGTKGAAPRPPWRAVSCAAGAHCRPACPKHA